MDLKKLRERAYKCACEHGFHDNDFSNQHWLCLLLTELSEAVDADRKGKRSCDNELKEILRVQTGNISPDWKKHWFPVWYDKYVKGSVDEELADAVIRLLDLAGLRNIVIKEITDEEIDDQKESCIDETFTESIYAICLIPIRYEYEYAAELAIQINSMIAAIFGLAKHLNIDLLWHIEMKIDYNETREKMHGKKY